MKISKIKKITKLNSSYDRYDIEVPEVSNFFANNILVHNCRFVWHNNKLWSRTGKEIHGVPELTEILSEAFPDQWLDGELYSDEMDFESILGVVRRSKDIIEDSRIHAHIFDRIAKGTFVDRFLNWKESLSLSLDRVNFVETLERPLDFDQNFFEDKYEGTMFRNGHSFYETDKRSSNLLKLKNFYDAEFTIVDVEPLVEKEKITSDKYMPGSKRYADGTYWKNGKERVMPLLGSFVCQTETGDTFNVGSGFTDEQRLAYWENRPIGKKCTVKYQEISKAGVPRFPIFIAVRDYE